MSAKRDKTPKIVRDRARLEKQIEEAKKHPGVAEVMEVYGHWAVVQRQVSGHLQAMGPQRISFSSDCSVE